MDQMTAEQAIKILDNAVAQINVNREGHITLVKAIEVLNGLVVAASKEGSEV